MFLYTSVNILVVHQLVSLQFIKWYTTERPNIHTHAQLLCKGSNKGNEDNISYTQDTIQDKHMTIENGFNMAMVTVAFVLGLQQILVLSIQLC